MLSIRLLLGIRQGWNGTLLQGGLQELGGLLHVLGLENNSGCIVYFSFVLEILKQAFFFFLFFGWYWRLVFVVVNVVVLRVIVLLTISSVRGRGGSRARGDGGSFDWFRGSCSRHLRGGRLGCR